MVGPTLYVVQEHSRTLGHLGLVYPEEPYTSQSSAHPIDVVERSGNAE